MKSQALFAAAVLAAASVSQGAVVIFDDALQNGASFWKEGSSTVALAPANEPTAGASASVKYDIAAAWTMCGINLSRSVTAPDTILQADVYRTGGGEMHLRHGNWGDLTLNAANSAFWSVDGIAGGSVPMNQWSTLRADLTGLNVTTINALAVKSTSNPTIWYVDNVSLTAVPEPTALAAGAIATLGLLRRRQR